MATESIIKWGLSLLWSPSILIMFLSSPAYSLNMVSPWWGLTNSSFLATTNRAGVKHLPTYYTGLCLSISSFVLLFMLDLINFWAIFAMNWGILVWVFASSKLSIFKLLKGESRAMPAIDGSLLAWKIEVTAPIDLPQRPIRDTWLLYLR